MTKILETNFENMQFCGYFYLFQTHHNKESARLRKSSKESNPDSIKIIQPGTEQEVK